jgi:hypothetical protein
MPTRRTINPRLADPTTAKGPRLGIAGSLAFHAAIVAATLLTWNRSLDVAEHTPIVPVDLVTIARTTNVAPMQIEKPPEQKITPPPLSLIAAPAVPQVQPPQIEVAPDTKPVKAPPKKQLQQDFSDLLNDLTKPQKGKRGARSIQGAGSESAMTADLADALTSQIYRCWSPPTGVPHAEDMLVTVHLSLNPDGTVAQPPQSSADFGGPYREAAIEAAERAIQACGPYKLPTNRYSEWRQSVVEFNPRNLTGQ